MMRLTDLRGCCCCPTGGVYGGGGSAGSTGTGLCTLNEELK